jgi:dipeptide/tripeptide permease
MSRFADFWTQVRQGFSRTFWVANILELFERFAFYGSKAVLVFYIGTQMGPRRRPGMCRVSTRP